MSAVDVTEWWRKYNIYLGEHAHALSIIHVFTIFLLYFTPNIMQFVYIAVLFSCFSLLLHANSACSSVEGCNPQLLKQYGTAFLLWGVMSSSQCCLIHIDYVLLSLPYFCYLAGMSPWNDGALACLKNDLMLNVFLKNGLGDKLEKVAGGFMDRNEVRKVKEKPNNSEQMEELIECLRGKGDSDFGIFLQLLRQTNNGVWAEALMEKASEIKQKGTIHMHI